LQLLVPDQSHAFAQALGRHGLIRWRSARFTAVPSSSRHVEQGAREVQSRNVRWEMRSIFPRHVEISSTIRLQLLGS
jgi:hypothetical protein